MTVARKAGEEGRLFGSVTQGDVAEAVVAAGVELRKQEVRLGDPIRSTGEFEVELHLHADINCTVRVVVVAES